MKNMKKKSILLSFSLLLAGLICSIASANIDVSFIMTGGDTQMENGRRVVRDSTGLYHAVICNPHAVPVIESLSSLDTWGKTWTPSMVLPFAPAQYPALAIDMGDILHLVWSDTWDIWYSNSPAGMNAWSVPLNLSNSPWSMSIFPSIDCDGLNTIHVVWQEIDYYGPGSGDEILYSASTDNGFSFNGPINVSNNPFESERPCVACPYDWSPGSAHVIWDEAQAGFQVYHTSTSNNGASWQPIVLVSQISPGTPDIAGLYSCLVVDGLDNPHVTYSQGSNQGGVFYNTSTDGGTTFGNREQVAATIEGFPMVTLAMDDHGELRVLWHEKVNLPQQARTLFYSYKEQLWDEWTPPVSFNTLDYHDASYVYKNQLGRGGYAVWTDYIYPQSNIQSCAAPPLVIWLSNTPSEAEPGDTITWTVHVENHTSFAQTIQIWLEVRTPSGAVVTKSYGTYTVPPYFSGSGNISLKLPPGTPLGTYIFSMALYQTSWGDWDRDSFSLLVK